MNAMPRTATRNAIPPITPPAIAPAWLECETAKETLAGLATDEEDAPGNTA